MSNEANLRDSYKPKDIEKEVRDKWKTLDLGRLVEQRLSSKKREMYIDGPPTLNGEPHMGHLRGRVMKDLWYRFETLRGSNIDFRGGWDCQGLPVELQAEKELGLTSDKTNNLKKVGEEKLVETCKQTVQKYHSIWRETDETLGLLINDERAYFTYRDSYIEREWKVLKSAWHNSILSEGYRVTPFCPNCQTSLSAAEVALGGYENLEDPSVYFKMKVKGQEGLYLVLWTTMPFTVVTDELVGVKPSAEYCYVQIAPKKSASETWIVGVDRLEPLMKELRIDSFEVMKKVRGKELEGLKYEHPLADQIPGQNEIEEKSETVHRVVAEEFVDVTTGSGLVHMSPANGEDDFEVAQRRKVPVFNPIDERADFTSQAGTFADMFVRDADQKVGNALRDMGMLLRYGKIKHEYPICWRSGHRLVWLARREYFYFVDRLGDRAVNAGEKAEYYYEQPKNRFMEIIKEKRPWCISRERVWGTPLPIWKCDSCGNKEGFFAREEIIKRAKSLPDGPNFEFHRPWIDRIEILCSKCGSRMTREPFVLDTWHNSGAAPYASLTDKEYQELVPVPFMTEGIDQTRGWAYTLLIENVILKMRDQASFNAFLFQGLVLDEKGEKLSKSKGNFIPVRQLLDQNSVDLTRLYLMWKASPIDSINFSIAEMLTRPYQILNTLYHVHVFYFQNSSFDGFSVSHDSKAIHKSRDRLRKQDRWILSRLGGLVDICMSSYLKMRFQEAAHAIERFLIEDLSQTYIPIIRGEMLEETEESKKRREMIYLVLGRTLLNCDALLHPIAPYLTDYLASEVFGTTALLLTDWPESLAEYRDSKLEVEFDLLSKMVSLTNSARMKGRLKRRWPLRQIFFLMNEDEKSLVEGVTPMLLEQTNLSKVAVDSDPSRLPLTVSVKPNFELVAPRAKSRMNELADKLAKADPLKLFNDIMKNGKARLGEMPDFELTLSDLVFSFAPTDSKYAVAENFGMVAVLDTSRDEELETQGTVRDIARNLQAMRKRKGFNPTDLVTSARIAGLGSRLKNLLDPKKDELAFLVRAKSVELYDEKPEDTASWSSVDLEGSEIWLSIG
jgi:isoleucyl-tRNA synthetase